jgi:hypothetical protein
MFAKEGVFRHFEDGKGYFFLLYFFELFFILTNHKAFLPPQKVVQNPGTRYNFRKCIYSKSLDML